MSDNAGVPSEPLDPRVAFAAERTLLAWIRSGLALMGFGFVVARFGLFLRELAFQRGAAPHAGTPAASLAIGISLVLLGVAVTLCAAARHWRTMKRLERGLPLRFSPFSLAILVAGALALLGLAIAAYLLLGL